MEIRQLKYFMAVAEEGNFGLAAHKCSVSQPPITRQIRKLEEEVGAQLLKRTPKGSELTEAGRVFFSECAAIVSALERAKERASAAHKGELGALRIGYFGSVSYSVVPRVLQFFKQRNPSIDLHLTRLSKLEQVDALKRGDLHIGFGRYYQADPDLVCEEIAVEDVSVCVPKNLFLDLEPHEWPRIFDSLPLVTFPASGRPNFADEALSMLKREGITPRHGPVVEDGRAAIMQVAVGAGACLVPDSMVGMNWYGVRTFRPEALSRNCPVSIIYRRADTSSVLRRFVSAMREFDPLVTVAD